MANIKTTDKQWSLAREYFEAGLSLSDIEKKTGVSKSSISKKASKENWPKGNEKKRLITQAVDVLVAKETLNETALQVHDEIVSDLTKHIVFFRNAAVLNVRDALKAPCESQGDFRQRAETILKGKEVVFGKSPDTAIQINNANQQAANSATRDEIRQALQECGDMV